MTTKHISRKGRSAPATKGDIWDLEKRIDAKLFSKIDTKTMETYVADIKHHFDVVAENMLYDFKGAFKDKLSVHDDRLDRLEVHTGLRRA
jgi:hypothetical protein